MPRTIKKELQRIYDLEVEDLIPLHERDPNLALQTEKALADIKGLPSYWLIAEPFWIPFIVFECKLNSSLEAALCCAKLDFYVSSHSDSPYYGIY